jgi:hypothetical protein
MQKQTLRTKNSLGLKLYTLGFCVAFGVLCSLPIIRAQADSPSGDIAVDAQVVESTPTETAKPSVVLENNQSIANATVTVKLVDLEPFSLVQIYVQSTPVLICSGFADKYGLFDCKAILPSDLSAGTHEILTSAQKAGEIAPSLRVVKTFAISIDGVVRSKGSGSADGSTVTESPAPSPTATAGVESGATEGVLYVGGVELFSNPSWNWSGEPLKASVVLRNAYKRTYSVNVRIETKAWGLFNLAEPQDFQVSNLKRHETRSIVQTIEVPGQWGFYSSTFTVIPPKSIDDNKMLAITRNASTFVAPLSTLSVLVLLLVLELIRRFWLAPRISAHRWIQELAAQEAVDLKDEDKGRVE